ncbi:nitroreductase family deazaflavin-dependent oxidoreductase [Nakamurella sp. YIM 132087]|uniref:Nitroreductase family deazaflavin-dependent oxidoreductase n=1 Tax=Nakamurella alba TaxID=2665158 RepID=A0A7K1FHR8_9ACTN|nr:nitroreductase family deazaflavin-dependent oxidoreductase [Nakamurella alba]
MRTGPVRRRLRLLVTLRPVARLSARFLPALDRIAFRISRGRLTLSGALTGLPVVELITTGARSGEPRSTRVLAVPDADGFVVVGANFGGDRDPAWCHNLRSTPEALLRKGSAELSVVATELHGVERDRGFDRALALNPGWQRFRRATGRRIPVFALTPATP